MAPTERTNLLRDRLCQSYEDDLSVLNIPWHDFIGACQGILGGYISEATVRAQIDPPLSAQEEADWNALLARMTAKANTGNTNPRERCLMWWQSVLVWHELGDKPAFATPDQVWNWLIAS